MDIEKDVKEMKKDNQYKLNKAIDRMNYYGAVIIYGWGRVVLFLNLDIC